jgi:hypothetical protein
MNKTHTQPTSISAILPEVLKPITKKFSSNLLEIQLNWHKISGDDLSKITKPSKIYKVNNKNILEILVYKNYTLEISYSSDEIKKKLIIFINLNMLLV